jgi:uncharacterized protein YndB with AHSA1/START domain
MPVSEQGAVVRETEIEARPETVFGFLVEPDKMVRWMGRTADLDARPGGIFRVDINGEHVARGEYVEVVPHERVVFTWGWEGEGSVRPGESTVEVTLEPIAAGTRVRLVHRDLPSEASMASHGHGWDNYVPRLTVAAAGGDPGPDAFAEQTDQED